MLHFLFTVMNNFAPQDQRDIDKERRCMSAGFGTTEEKFSLYEIRSSVLDSSTKLTSTTILSYHPLLCAKEKTQGRFAFEIQLFIRKLNNFVNLKEVLLKIFYSKSNMAYT